MKPKCLAIIVWGCLPLSVVANPATNPHALYGPIQAQDTLWRIAEQSRPDSSITTQQMMAAIRDYNPHAFINGDIHTLQKGVTLYMPNAEEVHQAQLVASAAQRQQLAANASKAQLRDEITRLRKQLALAQSRSQQLAKQLQTEQQQSRVLSSRLQQLQAKPKTAPPVPAPVVSGTAEKEATELKQLLQERDTHIQHLQASLREASIAIKRQYAESVALHQQLKALDPNNQETIPPPPEEIQPDGSNTPKAGLTLEGTTSFPTAAKALPVEAENTPANVPPSGMSLQQWLTRQAAQQSGANPSPALRTPSWISLLVAGLAGLFIAGLWWRNKAQQRALQREEAALRAKLAEDLIAEPDNGTPDTSVVPTTSTSM